MQADEVLEFIQFYRHELLNKLQVIQGYVQMGRTEKANHYFEELFTNFAKERKLIHLNIPHVFLWFYQYKKENPQFNLSYSVEIQTSLNSADMYIKNNLEQIMQDIKEKCDPKKIYRIHLNFYEHGDDNMISVQVDLSEKETQFGNISLSREIDVRQTADKRIYSFTVDSN